MGLFMIGAAFKESWRAPILLYSLIEKAFMVFLVASNAGATFGPRLLRAGRDGCGDRRLDGLLLHLPAEKIKRSHRSRHELFSPRKRPTRLTPPRPSGAPSAVSTAHGADGGSPGRSRHSQCTRAPMGAITADTTAGSTRCPSAPALTRIAGHFARHLNFSDQTSWIETD